MNPIPYGRQHITDEDIKAVVDVLKSDYLTQGPKIAEFEKAFAKYTGSKYAVAISNGTAALHLSALALNIKPGDIVITTPITFAASANCVKYCGGELKFADIDLETFLLDINRVREILQSSPKGTYRGIIPVDFAGYPVNMEEFRILADEFCLWIMEDACHSPGAYFTDSKGQRQLCGNGKFSELSVFSFHPVKHITTGEGGMITTNNEKFYRKLRLLRTHGITKDPDSFSNPVEFAIGSSSDNKNELQTYPGWYYEMQDLGYNYRLTDFQAALGLSQLKRTNKGLSRRKQIAKRYYEALKDKQYIKRQSGYLEEHAYHLYIIEVEDRRGLYEHLKKHKIFAQVHYIPVHLMPYYRQYGWKEEDLPNALAYYKTCLSLPIFPSLKDEEQEYVINSIKEYFGY